MFFQCLINDEGEFIAADAEGVVAWADTALKPHRNFPEQLVAGIVAVGIVDGLEVVEVEIEQGESLPFFLFELKHPAEIPVVEQSGQAVGVGQPLQLPAFQRLGAEGVFFFFHFQRRIQLVIIGTGEEKYEWYLNTLRERFGDKVSVNLLFDGGLANLVYAASDLYLMPSKSEPCGLSQLIAMRMGSVPVVNATGGLKDTVWPYNEADETGRGFTFQSYNADDFLAAIDRALALYYNEPEKWLRLAENDMAIDSSWDAPAQKYMALFQSVCGL